VRFSSTAHVERVYPQNYEPIKSTFATVRNRSKVTNGLGSCAGGIAMAYKLIEAAQSRCRAADRPHLVALFRDNQLTTAHHKLTHERSRLVVAGRGQLWHWTHRDPLAN
jgi:hypothetical protein